MDHKPTCIYDTKPNAGVDAPDCPNRTLRMPMTVAAVAIVAGLLRVHLEYKDVQHDTHSLFIWRPLAEADQWPLQRPIVVTCVIVPLPLIIPEAP